MSDADAVLWKQVDDAFEKHVVYQAPLVNLNRIAARCLGLWFDSSTCTVREELLPLDELKKLKRYSEDDDRPAYGYEEKEPIVVLAYQGQRLVIDGRRRVTRWINQNDPKPRLALIIEPRGRP
jgi:hypothetical protein